MDDGKYKTLVASVRAEVLDGKYGAGRPLPSIRALMRRFALSSSTVRRAFDELERTGIVVRVRGSGTFVSSAAATRRIGLIVPGVAYSEFFPPMVSEVSRLAQRDGYDLVLGDVSHRDAESRAKAARRLARDFASRGVAGVLYQPIELVADAERTNREILATFDRAGMPVVILDNDFLRSPSRSGYDVVGIDNFAAGMTLANHLLSAGARKIHFQKRPLCSASVDDRALGVANAVRAAGRERGFRIFAGEPDDLPALRAHLRRGRPDAFVCGNDRAASLLRNSLAKIGLRVPEDVMLAGFDDVMIATVMSPQLTTIRQPCAEIAATAFRRLVARLADPALSPVRITLSAPLVVRASTCKV